MRIYLSTPDYKIIKEYNQRFPNHTLNVLRSFGRPNKDNITFFDDPDNIIKSLILDSGTWTLNNSQTNNGMNITREGYQDYLLRFQQHFEFYFNFDSNHDPEGFSENIEHQIGLEAAGLKPVPVIHDIYGEEVQYYIDNGYSLIAIGSKQSPSPDELGSVIHDLFSKGIRVHLFGNTQYDYLANSPVFSSDSSSWTQAGAWGNILFWDPLKQGSDKTAKICLGDFPGKQDKSKTRLHDYEHRDALTQYLKNNFEFTINDLYGKNNLRNRQIVNMFYYIDLQERIDTIHQQKEF